jgi:phage terminase Nu1 subunit (DNA packaging protein)
MCIQSVGESVKVSESVGYREYARRRGCSLGAVQRAVKSGRIKDGVIRDERGRPRILPDLADAEWQANTLSDREPASARAKRERGSMKKASGASAYQAAQTEVAQLRARRERLDYAVRAGNLVDARAVENTWTEILIVTRTRILGVPAKVKQRYPDVDRQLLATLDGEIRAALEQLADPQASRAGR